jgi:cell division protein FtsN
MIVNRVLLVVCLALGCLSACSRQQTDWEKTRAANTTDSYEGFLKKYPSGEFTAQAEARVKELYQERDWQKARDTDTLEAYQAFLKQYPEGKWTEEARIRVENFTLAAPGVVTGADVAAQAPAPAPAPAGPPPASAHPSAPSGPPARVAATRAPVHASKPAPQPSASGGYGIQLGAFKSSADAANRRWAELDKKYPKLLAGLTPTVSPKKLAANTLYRLQVHNLSENHARSICKRLRANSQGCVIVPPLRS